MNDTSGEPDIINQTTSNVVNLDDDEVQLDENNDNVIFLDGNGFLMFSNSNLVVEKLLMDWGFTTLIESFRSKDIDLDAMKFMTLADVDILIPINNLGLRIRFKQRLLEWRIQNNHSVPLAETCTSENLIPCETHSSIVTASTSSTPSKLSSSVNFQASTSSPSLDLNLSEILNRSALGKSLIHNYLKSNKLQYDEKNSLCTIIAEYWVESKQQVILSTYLNAFSEIKKIFPTEEQEYYVSVTKEIGKLNRRYYSLSRKYQLKGLVESRYNLKRKLSMPKSNISNENNESHGPTKAEVDALEWLKFNKTPEPTVYKKWSETYYLRRRDITEHTSKLYENWPLFKQNIGACLVELDFDKLYPEKDLLSVKFSKFSKDIIDYYKANIKDESSLKALNELQNYEDIDSIDFTLINLLSSILIPPIIHYMENDKRRSWKPTILDSQNFIILRVETSNDVKERVNSHRLNLKSKGFTNQPFIVAVGSIEKLIKLYVSVDDYFYEVDSVKKALSITYKIFHVLNIEYPKGAKQVWEFMQAYFFETPLKGKKTSQLMALLGALK